MSAPLPLPGAQEELQRLRQQNAHLQAELDRLKLAAAGLGHQEAPQPPLPPAAATAAAAGLPAWDGLQHGLSRDQIARYSRQIVLHSFGVQGEGAASGGAGCCLL